MGEKRQIDLMLLGKTGNGKSATGNTILGRKAFKSAASSTSVTKRVSAEVSEYKGNILKVVDGPGIGDTRLDDEAGMNLVMAEMQTAIKMNCNGYHAFVLVIRFGTRITKEDSEAVELLKTIFGSLIVKNHCILLFTYGDIFEQESEETGETFQQWYRAQEGALRGIIKECGERVVLFDNRTKDSQTRADQIDSLLQHVENLQMQGSRYCDEHFEKAKDAREKAKILAKEPQIRDETMAETSLILQKLDQIQKIDRLQDKLPLFDELKSRVDALGESIKKQDNGTGALHKLAGTVESIKQAVCNEAEVTHRIIEEEKIRKAEEKKLREEREASEKKFMEQQEALKRKLDEDRKEYEARLANEEEKRKAGEKKLQEEREASDKKFMEQQEALKRKLDDDRKAFEARLANEEEKRKAGEQKQREERKASDKKFMEQQEAMKRKLDGDRKEYEARLANEEQKQREEREASDKKFMEQQEALTRRLDDDRREYEARLANEEEKRKAEKQKNKEELAKRDRWMEQINSKFEQDLREREAQLKKEAEKHQKEAQKAEQERQKREREWERRQEETRRENERRCREMEAKYQRQKEEIEEQLRESSKQEVEEDSAWCTIL